MHPRRVALFTTATLVTLALVPLAQAGPGTSTPAGAACVLTDTDACTQRWSSSQWLYLVSASGKFTGTTTVTLTSAADPLVSFTQTCTGEMVGIVMTSGSCTFWGTYPSGDMVMDCTSSGVGVVACSVAGQ